MANLTGTERARYVQNMFAHIAQRYDLMNRLMTAGQDVRWRQMALDRAGLPPDGRLLDLGTGTGDLAATARQRAPGCQVVAADFTLEMMRVGQQRFAPAPLNWTAADAGRLPFPGESFDAVVSGFLLRNLSDLDRSLREQHRVLKPGGRIVALDTTPPPGGAVGQMITPFIRIHLHTIIPILGRLISGQAEAYQYLPETTEGFLEPERLAGRLLAAGFREVGFQRLMFGMVAVHWGTK